MWIAEEKTLDERDRDQWPEDIVGKWLEYTWSIWRLLIFLFESRMRRPRNTMRSGRTWSTSSSQTKKMWRLSMNGIDKNVPKAGSWFETSKGSRCYRNSSSLQTRLPASKKLAAYMENRLRLSIAMPKGSLVQTRLMPPKHLMVWKTKPIRLKSKIPLLRQNNKKEIETRLTHLITSKIENENTD